MSSKMKTQEFYNEIEAKPFTDILKLVKFPNKAEEEIFHRLPLTDRQKEELLFDSIPELKEYSHLIKQANHEAKELLRSESIPSSPPKLERSLAAECISLVSDDEDDHPELFPEEEDEESDNSVESKARPHKPDTLE